MPSGTIFPIELNINKMHELLSLIKINIYANRDKLVYILSIPLISAINFNANSIIPIPILLKSDTYIFRVTESNFESLK